MRALGAGMAIAVLLLGWIAERAHSQLVFNPKSSILNSKHDFRAVSPAAIKSVSETDPCIFCHTPHNANPGPEIWNHKMGTTVFPSYTSSTMQSTTGQISDSDSSKLCLSCHDGTIALASTVNNGEIEFLQGPDYKLPTTSASNLAGDGSLGFSDDHPFAFVPNLANAEINQPVQGDPVRLEYGKVQCISCHDPHKENIDATQGKFLVKVNQASALCLTCHDKAGWTQSAHQAPPDIAQDQKYTSLQGAHTGYIGVANNGCEGCHRPHAAGSGPRLMKFVEESTCYRCHNGSVSTRNVEMDFTIKTYRHPVDTTPSGHDAAEGPQGAANPIPETSANTPRHSECVDCHNPHMARPSPPDNLSFLPTIALPLTGTSGLSTLKVFLTQATNEYEICFKCHADSANRPQLTDGGTAGIGYGRNAQRQFDFGNPEAFNTRVEFTQSASFHPVTQSNPMATTASLRPYMIAADGMDITTRPLDATSVIFCTDCHASDTNRTLGAGNTGPTGSHGSNIEHLLERQYVLETPPAVPGDVSVGVSYTPGTYALCFKCHNEQSLLNDETFKKHRKHIEVASCGTCHDPHASQSPHLINFDLSIVGPSKDGPVNYTQISPGQGSCTLSCHGKDHHLKTY